MSNKQEPAFSTDDWSDKGVLVRMGYRVGAKGIAVTPRRIILRRVLDEPFDKEMPRHVAADWGSPRSSKRLEKLTRTLTQFVRNAQSKDADMYEAIESWKSDLSCLKAERYDNLPEPKFQWPEG